MKKVISISALYLLLMGSFFNVTAQDRTNSTQTSRSVLYSVGVDGSIATGKLRDAYRYGLGGSLEVSVPITNTTYITGSTGFQNFFYRHNNMVEQNSSNGLQLLPVKAGLKYFPVSIFYLQAEAGVAFLLNKSKTDFDKTTAFIYAPQAGVQFKIGRNQWIDGGLRYEHSSRFESGEENSKLSFFGLRTSYTFTLTGAETLTKLASFGFG